LLVPPIRGCFITGISICSGREDEMRCISLVCADLVVYPKTRIHARIHNSERNNMTHDDVIYTAKEEKK
jgi:hypothetical protein